MCERETGEERGSGGGREGERDLPVKAYYDQSKANKKREEVPSDGRSV